MKFAIAYYLLLIYLTVMLQPLIPIAEDALSHCFAEAYHVATIHAKYGNNHVEIALANDAKDDNSKNQTNIKAGEQTLLYLPVNEELLQNFIKDQPEKTFFYYPDKLCEIFISKHIPPPKFSKKDLS